jgi:hypothetical protein
MIHVNLAAISSSFERWDGIFIFLNNCSWKEIFFVHPAFPVKVRETFME